MKKIFLFLLIIPFVFSSCSSDDESLDGTTWELYEEGTNSVYSSTIKFQKSTYSTFGYEEYKGERDEFSETGSYTYDHPIVTIINKKGSYTAKISGNKMTFDSEDGDGAVYTKK
jgi:hypothetical protein